MKLNKCHILIIFIFEFVGCKVIIPQWPDPYSLPDQIVNKQYIGKRHKIASGIFGDEKKLYPVAPGSVFLKNKNIIKGNIWIQTHYVRSIHSYIYPQVQIITRNWSEINSSNINHYFTKEFVQNVDSVRMDIPLPDTLGDSTTFVNSNILSSNVKLSESNKFINNIEMFWRKLLSNKTVSIFDDFSYGKQYKTTNIIAIKINDDSLLTISNHPFDTDIKKELQKFIEKRYNNANIQSGTITQMLKFILNKETELAHEPVKM